MDGDISVGHQQRTGTAGQTSVLCSCTKGPRVHQQSLSFSSLGQVPTTEGLINGLGQRMKLKILKISTSKTRIQACIISVRLICWLINLHCKLFDIIDLIVHIRDMIFYLITEPLCVVLG